MPDMALRLARLRELAEKHTSESYGREDVEELLEQLASDPDAISCPRYVAITEHADERRLLAGDSLRELIATLSELATGEIQERPEAIIDLDTNTRREATNSPVITFTPPLRDYEERLVRFVGGERSALRLLCEIAEEHASGNQEAADAVAIVDRLLQQAYPAADRGERP